MRIELVLFLTFLLMVILFIACSVPRRPTPMLVPTLFPALTLSTHDPQFVSRIGERAPGAATILPAQPGLSQINVGPPPLLSHSITAIDLPRLCIQWRGSGD